MAESKQLLGKILAEQVKQRPAHTPINEVEFSVYSQFGEDGMIQFITHHLKDTIKNKIFIEIGVQNYSEANTRFLLENDTWEGIIVDCNDSDVKEIKESSFYWRNNLFAKKEFITRDNINSVISEFDLPRDIGLLSLDIDGNDYWVLERLNVLNPAILILEYNSYFGLEAPISIPYREDFVWQKAHPATYYGASLPAFCYLLEKRGYELLGSTLAGNNVFFVHKDINQGKLPVVSCAQGYKQAIFNSIPCNVPQKFIDQIKYLKYQQVVDVRDNTLKRLHDEKITLNNLSQKFNCINDFLELNNEDFVFHAYRYLLCREPDDKGFLNFLTSLKKGKSKENILKEIRFSPEGKNIGTHIEGLTTLEIATY